MRVHDPLVLLILDRLFQAIGDMLPDSAALQAIFWLLVLGIAIRLLRRN